MDAVRALLERSRAAGFLGPGPVQDHIVHSRHFLDLIPHGASVVDLGTGGGVPGLVVAVERSDVTVVMVDASERRTEFLDRSVRELELEGRVSVERGRAEVLARRDDLRGCADVVVARSFGPPGVTAECAVGFLRGPGSSLVVSEPPPSSAEDSAAQRWPVDGLSELGFGHGEIRRESGVGLFRAVLTDPPDDRWPRRTGVPRRRPVF